MQSIFEKYLLLASNCMKDTKLSLSASLKLFSPEEYENIINLLKDKQYAMNKCFPIIRLTFN